MNNDAQDFEKLSLLDQLRGLCLVQQELLRVALFVASEGQIEYEGEKVKCSLNDGQRRVSSLLAMTAGQSVNSVLKFSELRGIQVRDCYPIARTSIESFINAAYLLSESDSIADRAIKYVSFANWKRCNRKFGSGDYSIEINLDPHADETLANKFPEFSGKGNGSWTSLDTPSRIRRVGELAGRKSGTRLLAAYGLTYSLSSEVIHGSPFGASFFYSAYLGKEALLDDFMQGTVKQLEEIMIAILHAGCGYLSAFFNIQNMKALSAAEQVLFEKILEISQKSDVQAVTAC